MPNAPPEARVIATLALSAGGLGLASGVRVRPAAHWASWADSLRTGTIDRKVDHRRVGGRQPVAVFPFCQAMPTDIG